MKLQDLKMHSNSIWNYCQNSERYENMLNALDEDLPVDRHQDTQPGGGDSEDKNRKDYEKVSEKLAALNGESVFGELYQDANKSNREVLDALLAEFRKNYSVQPIPPGEANLAYQMTRFLNCVSDLDYAKKDFTLDDIQLLTKGGNHFLELVTNSEYDYDKEEFSVVPTVETAKEFLKEEGFKLPEETREMSNEDFFRERIVKLRRNQGISAYKMSLDLGHSKSYMQSISSGKALPSLLEFFNICEYLGVTPKEFFDTETEVPQRIHKLMEFAKILSEEDLIMIINLMERLMKGE